MKSLQMQCDICFGCFGKEKKILCSFSLEELCQAAPLIQTVQPVTWCCLLSILNCKEEEGKKKNKQTAPPNLLGIASP